MKLLALLMSMLAVASALGGMSGWQKVVPGGYNYHLFKSYQPAVQSFRGSQFSVFEPVEYQEQVVAGMNYKIRYVVDSQNSMMEVTAFQPLAIPGQNTAVQISQVQPVSKLLDLVEIPVVAFIL